MGATLFGQTAIRPSEQLSKRRRDNLAVVFQDLLTVIVRIRDNRQRVADARAFRTQMQSALRVAEKDGISKLYPPEDVRLATSAIVAFLDETILNSSNPAFSDWARMPLQEEMFGHNVGGEVFFQNVNRLLARSDSHGVGDLLEIYSLCILLGYKGKYGIEERDSVRPVVDAIGEKILRIRGPLSGFSPSWQIPEGLFRAPKVDHWIGRLTWAAVACILVALGCFFVFRFLLNNDAHGMQALAAFAGW
jgi:type VI secretion system protein ImpK